MITDALPLVIVAGVVAVIVCVTVQMRLWYENKLRITSDHERRMAELRIKADEQAAEQLLAQSRQDNPPVLELEARKAEAEAEAAKARADVEYQQVINREIRRHR